MHLLSTCVFSHADGRKTLLLHIKVTHHIIIWDVLHWQQFNTRKQGEAKIFCLLFWLEIEMCFSETTDLIWISNQKCSNFPVTPAVRKPRQSGASRSSGNKICKNKHVLPTGSRTVHHLYCQQSSEDWFWGTQVKRAERKWLPEPLTAVNMHFHRDETKAWCSLWYFMAHFFPRLILIRLETAQQMELQPQQICFFHPGIQFWTAKWVSSSAGCK